MNTHIIVVNWRNAEQTVRCLRSLEDLRTPPPKVWVVDNGSRDGSVDRLARFINESTLSVCLIESEENLGFGGGCNLGIHRAFAEGADSVWLLNNDAVADRDALEELQKILLDDAKIGAVGSVVYDLRRPNRIQVWGGGKVYLWAGLSTHFRRPVSNEQIDYLTGASLLLRRAALEEVGGLDSQRFFMYWEDTDLCQRLRSRGWLLAVAQDSRIWHELSSSLGRTHVLKDYYVTRSAGMFARRYAKWPSVAWFIGTTLRAGRRLLGGRSSNWRAITAAWRDRPPPSSAKSDRVRPSLKSPSRTSTLRIAIEASTLEGKRAGIGHYTEQISEALSKLSGVELSYFTSQGWSEIAPGGGAGLAIPRRSWIEFKKHIPLGRGMRLHMQRVQLDRLVRKWSPDVVFGPNYVLPESSTPQILVVHDLSHLRHPSFHPRARIQFLERYFPKALARAQAVMTVSEFTKQELLHFFPELTGRVLVVYPGISERFRRPPTNEQERALDILLKGERRPYLLFLSTLEPRKNIGRLLSAYSRLPTEIRQRHPLVMTGQMGWQETQFTHVLDRMVERGEIILTGYVRDELLPALYGRAKALLYPSLYEGFGLPPVEAMACGCPSLVGNVSAMPEVCGDAAVYCDPMDEESITDGIRRVMNDGTGSDLRRLGLVRQQLFSWKRAVDQMVGIADLLTKK